MKYKLKKIAKNWRVITLLLFVILAIVAINPHPNPEGLMIRSVATNSSAQVAGIVPPKPTAPPLSKENLIAINNVKINDLEAFDEATAKLKPDQQVTIQTNRGTYILQVRPITSTITLNETETITINKTIQEEVEINGTLQNITKVIPELITRKKTETKFLGVEDLGIRVAPAPSTNIRKGLDLQGGTRVLLQPEEEVDKETLDLLIANMEQRLNVFGLSDVILRSARDLSGNQFIVVEIAGANEEEVQDLLSKQGKFEAKIGNTTVFRGGQDITYVCRSADCSGIDPASGCGPVPDGSWQCRFRFSISLTPEAAQRQADATALLEVLTIDEHGNALSRQNQYLSKQIDLLLDDQLVDALNIGAELKGRSVPEISITGPGFGQTDTLASQNALEAMKRMQTILITGSLPVKLTIVKSDSISPLLGPEFIKNAWFVGVLAILAVASMLFIRYRKLSVAIPVIVTMASELILLLGFAAIVGWNLDLAAIAGIIIAVGTSADHQIIIVDETLRKEQQFQNWKTKIKNAFFIIMGAYLTTVMAMVPLLFAGAGLLKGFALTTIAGVSFGVFISRPAFAAMMQILLED